MRRRYLIFLQVPAFIPVSPLLLLADRFVKKPISPANIIKSIAVIRFSWANYFFGASVFLVFRLVFVSCQDAQAPSIVEEITYLGAEVEYKRFVFTITPHSKNSSGKNSASVLVRVRFVSYGGRKGLLCVSDDCRSQGDSQE